MSNDPFVLNFNIVYKPDKFTQNGPSCQILALKKAHIDNDDDDDEDDDDEQPFYLLLVGKRDGR